MNLVVLDAVRPDPEGGYVAGGLSSRREVLPLAATGLGGDTIQRLLAQEA